MDDYLLGKLYGEQLSNFETALKHDPALAEEVTQAKIIHQLMLQKRLLDVKSITQKERLKSRKNNIVKYSTITIIVWSLISGGFFILHNNEKKQNEIQNEVILTDTVIPIIDNHDLKTPEVKLSSRSQTKLSINETTAQKKEESRTIVYVETIEDTISNVNNKTEEPLTIKQEIETPEENKKALPAETVKNASKPLCDKLNVNIISSGTCFGKNEGEIIIDVSGEQTPIIEQLTDENGEEIHEYEHLPSGEYIYKLEDANNCSIEKVTSIDEKNCPMIIDFNPSTGEAWALPIYNTYGTLTIYGKAGNIVFTTGIDADTQTEWNGYQSDGELLSGYYIFTIEYDNGKLIKGNVTITE